MADALKAQGNAAFQRKDYEEAIKYFTEAIALDPSNHVLYSNRSAAEASLEDYEEALEDAQKCVELKPEWAKGYSRLGAAHFGLGTWSEAIAAYEKCLELDPGNAQAQEALASAREAAAERRRGPASDSGLFGPDALVKLALDPRTKPLLDKPEFMAMINSIRTNPGALGAHMNNPDFQLALEVVLGMRIMSGAEAKASAFGGAKMEEEEAAAGSGAKAAAPAPEPSGVPQPPTPEPAAGPADVEMGEADAELEQKKREALAEKEAGNAAYKARRFDEALSHYDRALELWDGDISFLTNRAAACYEAGDYEAAITDCDRAVERGRELRADFKMIARALQRKGNALAKLGRLEEAVAVYSKSLTEHRNAETLKKLNEAEKALKEEREAAYVDLDRCNEEKEAGNTAFKEQRFPEAVAHYTEALKRGPPAVNPEAHKLYSNLAACYTKLGAYPEGLKAAERCLELAPDFIKGYSRKGTLQFLMKEHDKALATYQAGLDRDPENAELKDGLMRTMSALNRFMHGDVTETELKERQAKAMADPEIQNILIDPVMRQVLQDLQENPSAAQHHMQNPGIRAKVSKLVTAGVVQMR